MYRSITVEAVASVDSSLTQPIFGPLRMTAYQSLDKKADPIYTQVGPSDAEAALSLNVTNGYAVAIFSDYPIMVRLNGVSSTQFTMHSNNVAAVNAGSPLPAQCCFVATVTVTSIRLAPISGATQTANVAVLVTGDPTNSYT